MMVVAFASKLCHVLHDRLSQKPLANVNAMALPNMR